MQCKRALAGFGRARSDGDATNGKRWTHGDPMVQKFHCISHFKKNDYAYWAILWRRVLPLRALGANHSVLQSNGGGS